MFHRKTDCCSCRGIVAGGIVQVFEFRQVEELRGSKQENPVRAERRCSLYDHIPQFDCRLGRDDRVTTPFSHAISDITDRVQPDDADTQRNNSLISYPKMDLLSVREDVTDGITGQMINQFEPNLEPA